MLFPSTTTAPALSVLSENLNVNLENQNKYFNQNHLLDKNQELYTVKTGERGNLLY